MGFADPLALGFSALIGVLVLLYLWERRRRAVTVPALFLWQSLREDTLRAQRLRPDLLFFLQLLALAALIGGFAKPYWTQDAGKSNAERHIIVADISASMQAREAEGSRWSIARERALQALRDLPPGAEVMLIAAADTPEVVVPFTRRHAEIESALLALEPFDTAGDLAVALAYANSARTRSDAPTDVTVYTDLSAADLPAAARAQVRVEQIGDNDDNLGIEALQVFQGRFQEPTSAALEARVRNYGSRPRHGSIQVRLEETVLLHTGFTLAAGAAQTFNLRSLPGPGRITAQLHAGDALDLDDAAYEWVRPITPLRVLVVTADEQWARGLGVLASVIPGLELAVQLPAAEWPAGAVDLVIYYQTSPLQAPPANALHIYPPRDNRWFPVSGEATDADILDWNARHPVLRLLRPVAAEALPRARIISPPPGSQGLLWSRLGEREYPLAFAVEEAGRRTICFAFDLEAERLLSSDNLGLFLFFLNSLAWLAPEPEDAAVVRTGQSYALPEAPSVEVHDPRGVVHSLHSRPPAVTPRHAGVYRLRTETHERTLLVNFNDARESAIGRAASGAAPASTSTTAIAGLGAAAVNAPPHFGASLLAFALAVLLAEWAVAWRRRT